MSRRRIGRRPPLLAARGGVSWVTLLLLASLAAAAYLAWVWIPVYVVHYEVLQVVKDHMNQAVKNPSDEQLVASMCHKIRSLAQVDVVAPDGQIERAPAVPLHPQDVRWDRDVSSSRRVLRVSFDYVRAVEHPYLGQVVEKTFEVRLESDLEIPDWGPKR